MGLLSAYGASRSGYCYAATVIDKKFQGTGVGLAGSFLFYTYIFSHFPMRKVYVEVNSFNLPQMSKALDRFFRFEGKLREHEYFAGEYHDLHFFSLSRERVEAEQEWIDRLLG